MVLVPRLCSGFYYDWYGVGISYLVWGGMVGIASAFRIYGWFRLFPVWGVFSIGFIISYYCLFGWVGGWVCALK